MARYFPEINCGTGRSRTASSRVSHCRGREPNKESGRHADREQLEFLAAICPEYEAELREVLREDAQAPTRAARDREQLEFLATISPRHEQELYALRRAEAEAQQERELLEFVRAISTPTYEDGWDPALHPRTGTPPNAGW